jgi:hypothetical protein
MSFILLAILLRKEPQFHGYKNKDTHSCHTWGCHGRDIEYYFLVRCDDYRNPALCIFWEQFSLEDEGSTFLLNFNMYLSRRQITQDFFISEKRISSYIYILLAYYQIFPILWSRPTIFRVSTSWTNCSTAARGAVVVSWRSEPNTHCHYFNFLIA